MRLGRVVAVKMILDGALADDVAISADSRSRCRISAAEEFGKELARLLAQPVAKGPEAERARDQEKLCLNLCLKAVLPLA